MKLPATLVVNELLPVGPTGAHQISGLWNWGTPARSVLTLLDFLRIFILARTANVVAELKDGILSVKKTIEDPLFDLTPAQAFFVACILQMRGEPVQVMGIAAAIQAARYGTAFPEEEAMEVARLVALFSRQHRLVANPLLTRVRRTEPMIGAVMSGSRPDRHPEREYGF